MRSNIAWARNPIQNRLNDIPKALPMTIIYGSISWVRQLPDQLIRESRPNSYVDIQVNRLLNNFIYCYSQ